MENQNEKIKELENRIEQLEVKLQKLEDRIDDVEYDVGCTQSELINRNLI